MRTNRTVIAVLLALAVPSWGTGPAEAQSCFPYPVPWPNGCSVLGPLWLDNGLDDIFFGACTQHDLCYGTANPACGPCYGYGLKASCDAALAASMEAACLLYAGVLSFPGSGWIDADDFLEDCTYVAAVFYGAVSVFGFPAFETRQCCVGCNDSMCDKAGYPTPFFCTIGGSVCGSGGCGNPDPGCSSTYADTQVFALDLETGRLQRSDPAAPAGLVRTVELDGKTYFQEEWVLADWKAAGDPRVLDAASPRAAEQLVPGPGTLTKSHGLTPVGRFLIIEAARHADGRVEPLIRRESLRTGVLPSGPLADGRVTFRAGFSPQGTLDAVEVIEGDPATARTLAADLRVEFPFVGDGAGEGEAPHRSVVFATFEVKDGDPFLIAGVPVLPQCCCGDVFCV